MTSCRDGQHILHPAVCISEIFFKFSKVVQMHFQDYESGDKSLTDQVTEINLQALLTAVVPGIDASDAVKIPKVFKCNDQTAPCDHASKYRRIMSWCNNLRKLEVGKSLCAFIGLLLSSYDDGDYGIPGYNEHRAYCNMTRVKEFDDLRQEIPAVLVERLQQLYEHVDEIYHFPGGIAETAL